MEATLRSMPGWVGGYAEKAVAARGNPELVRQLLEDSAIPIVLYDDDRRYLDANHPAGVALGLSREELLRLRMDDLPPQHLRVDLPASCDRFLETRVCAGPVRSDQTAAPTCSPP